MSIEHNVTTGAPKTAQNATGPGAARKSGGTTEAGGFAALLMSLGADELPVETLSVAEPGQDPAQLPGNEAEPAVLVDGGLSAPQVPALPVAAPPVASEATVAATPSTTANDASEVQGVSTGARSRADAPAWQTLATSEPAQAQLVETGLPASGQAQPAADVQPLLRQAGLAQRLAQQRSLAADAAQMAQAQKGEDMAARLGWQIRDVAQTSVSVSPQAWLTAGLGEAGLRPYFERHADKHGARGGVGELGAFAGVARAESARLDVPAVAPDAGLTTEMRVAEQVSYYVGRGAQSAELEVEGVDEKPIHVSIDLQGQEARVEFRAEQAQTRQVLQDAVPHLREMLEREGLTLSDVSVGSSGSGRGQDPSSRERQGDRQPQATVPELAAAGAAGLRGSLPSGRSVDLFV